MARVSKFIASMEVLRWTERQRWGARSWEGEPPGLELSFIWLALFKLLPVTTSRDALAYSVWLSEVNLHQDAEGHLVTNAQDGVGLWRPRVAQGKNDRDMEFESGINRLD